MSSDAELAMFAAELGEAPEIDLHGMSIDEAIRVADFFIDREFVAGSEAIKIIHGRGTEKLRNAIHQFLKKDKVRVASFRDAEGMGQQGGVTLVALYRM